ncbi:MAG: GNAT family N-acetyltransferase [Cyclobacteriaceae bacterium]|nr:GNAT family N-acetyltransferase [Cyclobacteriaceae bacterium]
MLMIDLNVFAGNSFFYPIKDSAYLCFKTLEKTDREMFIAGFQKLSPKSIYHRFFGFMKELTEEQLENLLNIDQKDHVAWAAFDIEGDSTAGVGVGRYRRNAAYPEEAELALTIIDEYQGKGVGTILLGILYYLAGMAGIKVFTGVILSDNAKLIRRFKELGADLKRVGWEYEIRLPVRTNFDQLPKTPYAGVIRPVLHFLTENNFCL